MQVAAQPTPLLLSRGDQAHPGALKVAGECRGVHCRADLAGEVAQQPDVARRNRLTVPPLPDEQVPDLGGLVLQRHGQQVRRGLAVLGGDHHAVATAHRDRDLAQLERSGESLDSAC